MTKEYIGVKKVTAWEEDRHGQAGYAVKYEDGYVSWCPKDAFEKSYLCVGDSGVNKINIDTVQLMMGNVQSNQLDEKTTHVKSTALTGFVTHEVSSCVDPANYDQELGTQIATHRIQDKLWGHLGFVLQWALNGIKR